jgi:type IV pilus biogenesis protein PilP
MVKNTFTFALVSAAVLFSTLGTALAATVDPNEQSFAKIEALDQNIEQAGKEITSLQVSQKLADLQAQTYKMTMDFSVLRIYSFNQGFYAVIQFSNKTQATVSQGDLVKGRFKIVSILSNAVTIYDEESKAVKTVPFA